MQLQEGYHRCTAALAWAARDLNIHLAFVSGYIELPQNERLGPWTERQRRTLQDAQASSARLVPVFGSKVWEESEQGAGIKFCFLCLIHPAGVPAVGTR